jgi:hypothetical protein
LDDLALLALLAVASTHAGAVDGSKPQVVAAGSLPGNCKALGEVNGRHANETPREEEAQADAVIDARKMGATHVVTVDIWRCGGSSICYEGKAYSCPSGTPAAPAK